MSKNGWNAADDNEYGGDFEPPIEDLRKIPEKQDEVIEVCLAWKDPSKWGPPKKKKEKNKR